MGNATSNTKNSENDFSDKLLFRTINKISSDLILNSNNDDLLKFMEPEHCNKIINITSNILNENFTKNQLKIINNKIKKNNKKSVESFIQNLKSINDTVYDKNINEKKYNICKEIATYYVKIVHIFSAIKNVIDKDEPICNKTNKFKYEKDEKKSEFDVTISADICSKKHRSTEKTLSNENGIPELENLYKDEYMPETKKFVMSEKQKKIYDSDVSKFYKSYTGDDKPDEIKRFSDIPVLKYKSIEICEKMKDKSKSKLKGNSKNNNIVNFANHLANIMNNSRKFDKNLIIILNYLFIPDENNVDYIINDNLSFDDINEIIEKVRKIIMELYIVCDKDYREGIKLFEKILLDKNIELAEKRLKNTNKKYYNKFEENYQKNYQENYQENKEKDDIVYRQEKEFNRERDIKDMVDNVLEKENDYLLEKEKENIEKEKKEEEENKKRENDLDIDNKSMKYIEENYDFSDVNKILNTGIEKITKKIIEKYENNLCPSGHKLIDGKCIDDCGICDICNKNIKIGENSYFCQKCDFDVCNQQHDENDIVEAYLKQQKNENHMSIKKNTLKELNKIK